MTGAEAVAGLVVLAVAAASVALLSGGKTRSAERDPSAAATRGEEGTAESADADAGEGRAGAEGGAADAAAEGGEAIAVPIDGTLDLHHFSPKEVGDLIPDYLAACRARGIRHVRVIHGKGKGVLREKTWAILARHPDVIDYELAGRGGGGWGATEVTLRTGRRRSRRRRTRRR